MLRRNRSTRDIAVPSLQVGCLEAAGVPQAGQQLLGFICPGRDGPSVRPPHERLSQNHRPSEANNIITAFCEKFPATRYEPSRDELQSLWAKVSVLEAKPVSEALCEVIAEAIAAHSWQPQLRALRVVVYFYSMGDSGRAIARDVMDKSRDLLQHTLGHIPECHDDASKALLVSQLANALPPGEEARIANEGGILFFTKTPEQVSEPPSQRNRPAERQEPEDLLSFALPVQTPQIANTNAQNCATAARAPRPQPSVLGDLLADLSDGPPQEAVPRSRHWTPGSQEVVTVPPSRPSPTQWPRPAMPQVSSSKGPATFAPVAAIAAAVPPTCVAESQAGARGRPAGCTVDVGLLQASPVAPTTRACAGPEVFDIGDCEGGEEDIELNTMFAFEGSEGVHAAFYKAAADALVSFQEDPFVAALKLPSTTQADPFSFLGEHVSSLTAVQSSQRRAVS